MTTRPRNWNHAFVKCTDVRTNPGASCTPEVRTSSRKTLKSQFTPPHRTNRQARTVGTCQQRQAERLHRLNFRLRSSSESSPPLPVLPRPPCVSGERAAPASRHGPMHSAGAEGTSSRSRNRTGPDRLLPPEVPRAQACFHDTPARRPAANLRSRSPAPARTVCAPPVARATR